MTITIELTPDEEATLRAQAKRHGQEPETLLRDMVRTELAPAPEYPATTEEDHERLVQHLMAAGLMKSRPTGRVGPPPRPIVVEGPPVSQTLVEDRR